MSVYVYSQRTLASTELVTFAQKFVPAIQSDNVSEGEPEPSGAFVVFASRNAVWVRHAILGSDVDVEEFKDAIYAAAAAMWRMRRAGHGAKSLYPSTPTELGEATKAAAEAAREGKGGA